MTDGEGARRLEDLRAALHRDPRTVAEGAEALAAEAAAAGDDALRSAALALLGRARRSLGEIDLADAALTAAIDAAGDDADLAADAHLALAGVRSFQGRAPEAFAHLDRAEALGSERARTYAGLQRAIVRQRTGDLTGALAAYDAALPALHRLDLRTDLALVLMNRGVIRTQTADVDGAVADLTEAGERFAAEGNEFGVAQTRHGLGWAEARRGDLPAALHHLDDAEARFVALGHEPLEVQVDRAEVLLAAGLSTPARPLAEDLARRFAAAGNRSQEAEAWLLAAQAARLEGDRPGASAAAARARERFAAQGSRGWEQAARLEELRTSGDTQRAADLAALADELAEAGNEVGATTALAIGALAAAGAVDGPAASSLAERARARAERVGVMEARLLAQHAAARAALASDVLDAVEASRAARRAVRDGLRLLDRRRSALVASDARASIAVHGRALADLGLQLALRDGRAADVFTWMERARRGALLHRAARPPADPALAEAMAELRVVTAAVRAAQAGGEDVHDLVRRQAEVEADVQRARLRTAASGHRAARERVAGPAEVRAALGPWALTSLAVVEDRLVAVAVGPRRSRLVDLGPARPALDAADAAGTALRALAAAGDDDVRRRRGLGVLRRALTALDAAAGPALPPAGPAVLVVPPALHALPWSMLPSLAGRPVVVAPSATWWLAARAAESSVPGEADPTGGPVAVVAGPHLVEAAPEARAVAAPHPGAVVLDGERATVAATLDVLGRAALAHVVAHVRLRHDHPAFTAIDLADGPLCLYDLEALDATPAAMVLSGCDSGAGVHAGDALLGLASTLLAGSTRSLVASLCPLPDRPSTVRVMADLHRRLAAGAAPAEALAVLVAEAAHGEQAADDERAAVLACLGAFGT